MGQHDEDEARRREAAAILERIRQETEPQIGVGTGRLLSRAADHFAARDADPGDRIEVLGTRVGRLLGVVGFIVLAIMLLGHFALS